MLKKSLIGIIVIAVIGLMLYFSFVRERYMNTIHTEIDLSMFSEDLEGLEKMFDWYYKNYHIPAFSASIIIDGKIVKYISRGTYSKSNDKQVDENSMYQIASTSKVLTGIICRSLELEGVLDLEKSISEYLKGKLPVETQEKLRNVSLRHVVHHTSGLGRSMFAYAEDDIINSLIETELEFEPGSKHQYSNFGYGLLTYLMQEVTNKSYAELVQQYISEPYSLPDIKADVADVVPSELVTPYWKHFRYLEGETYDFGLQVGGSGVFTNTCTLSELVIKQMEAYEQFDSLKNSTPLILTHPKILAWNDNYYGYGFFEFNYEIDGIPEVIHSNLEHGGDADGFACIYDYFPDYKTGIVVQTSSGGEWLREMTYHMNGMLVRKHFKELNEKK